MFQTLKKFIKIFLILPLLNVTVIHVESGVINNEILLEDPVNNLTKLDVVSTSDTPYVYQDDGQEDGKKVLNIVVNPIIHNIANGYGGGDNGPGTTTVRSVPPTEPPLVLDILRVFFRKTQFITRLLFNSITSLVRASIRFVICTFVPICGLFGVFGDEIDLESTATPESVARGLDLLQGIIEQYHSVQNRTLA